MWLDFLFISPLIGVLCLDRVAIGQTMLSQPIICIPFLGAWFGQFETGLLAGGILQLFWLNSNLYGANIPSNETMASTTAVGSALALSNTQDLPPITLWIAAFLLTAPSAKLAQLLQRKLDHFNASVSDGLVKAAARHQDVNLGFRIFGTLTISLVAHSLLALFTLVFATVLLTNVPLLAIDAAGETLGFIKEFLLPALAVAVGLTLIRRRLYLALGLTAMLLIGALVQVSGSS